MRKKMRLFSLLVGILFWHMISWGQELLVSTDTANMATLDFEKEIRIDQTEKKLHSPKKAAIYEALVPGLGHIYNKKAWHLPFTYVAFGTAIFFIIDNTNKYKKYRDAYEDFSAYRKYLTQEPRFPLPIQEPKLQRFRKVRDLKFEKYGSAQLENFQNALKNNKDSFKRYRDLSYISLVGIYILNVVWATVDAHFFYYDVSDNLSLHLQPRVLIMEDYRRGLGVNMVLYF